MDVEAVGEGEAARVAPLGAREGLGLGSLIASEPLDGTIHHLPYRPPQMTRAPLKEPCDGLVDAGDHQAEGKEEEDDPDDNIHHTRESHGDVFPGHRIR